MSTQEKLKRLKANLGSVLLGKDEAVRQAMVALVAGGHILLEDVPGVGKTILARALAKSIDCAFSRIQLTPDLLPSDVLGVSVYDASNGEFVFKPGPLFANVVLADEINRATPRTQSALLEAMNESQATIDGKTYLLGPPFILLATQNPYDFEGTYFLLESQLDRFLLRTRIGYPTGETERRILRTRPGETRLPELEPSLSAEELTAIQQEVLAIEVHEAILEYVIAIAEATRRSEEFEWGLSPRASLGLMQAARASALLAGRDYVVPDDVKTIAPAVCVHRLLSRAYAYDGSARATETAFARLLEAIPVPQ